MVTNLQARDAATVLHPYSNLATLPGQGSLILERGEGVFVYDVDGKPYIEGMAGLWCNGLGHGREELVEVAAEQMRRLPFAHLFTGKSHDPAIALAEKLKELAPNDAAKVFFCNSGSEANDTQVKLVWYVNNALGRPLKKKIISRIKAYHGVTVASASLTGLPNNHIDFDLPLPQVRHAGCPHHYRFAAPGESESGGTVRSPPDASSTTVIMAAARSFSTRSMSRRAVWSRSSWIPSPTRTMATAIRRTVETRILARNERGTRPRRSDWSSCSSLITSVCSQHRAPWTRRAASRPAPA